MKRIYRVVLVGLLALAGCSTPIEVEPGSLDGPDVDDPSLTDPSFLVSTRPGLTLADRQRPVVIAVHGYSATTFEWQEFREYAESRSNVLVSQVLLGGHGRDVEDFQNSSWHDWMQPILDEYDALVAQGYKKIVLAGSSTGGTLLLELMRQDAFDAQVPTDLILIDPIIVPGDKMLSLAPVLGPVLGNVPQELSAGEKGYWYENRPAETLSELYSLTKHVRKELAKGFSLPEQTCGYLYKSTRDQTVDPVSALLIYKGVRMPGHDHIYTEMIDSDLHVFTRLRGRDPADVSEQDRRNQERVFSDMQQYALENECQNFWLTTVP